MQHDGPLQQFGDRVAAHAKGVVHGPELVDPVRDHWRAREDSRR